MTKQQITALVRQYLSSHTMETGEIEVLEPLVKQDGTWWYVPVRPHQRTEKTYQYYTELTDVENELLDKENVEVLLVPSA